MAKRRTNKRPKKYEPKLAVKDGVGWDDLISLSLQPTPGPKKVTPKSKKKTKR